MEYKYLIIDRQGGLLTCRMHNPPEQTLNTAMLHELHHLLGTIERDDGVRVFMVTGSDGVFLRWMDLKEMQAHSQADPSKIPITPVITPIHHLGLRIQNLHCVSIAAINGIVGGGGCEFSLSFDFRLMEDAEDATFALPQTSFGLVPGGGGAWHCIRLLGPAKALDVLLHGEFMPPSRALELGLISRLYPSESFEQACRDFADNMAKRAPLALQGVKRLVRAGSAQGQIEFFTRELQELGKVITSEDVQNALAMWLANPDPEAYAPIFKGR